MIKSLRLSTALVTSLSLVAGQMPIAAIAQTEGVECHADESAEDCLARALEAAATGDAAAADAAAAEAARLAEEAAAAAAQADADAAAAAQAQADAAAAAAAQAQADADAAAAAQTQADADAAAAAAQTQADADAAAAAQAQADADAAAAAAQTQADADAAAAAQAQADADADAAAQAQADADAAAEAEAAAAQAQADPDAAAAEQAQADADAAAEAETAEATAAEHETVEPDVETAETPTEGAPETDEDALAAALAEAAAESENADADATDADAGVAHAQPEQTAEDAAALEQAARLAAEAEAEAVADPTHEAEVEVEGQAVEAEEQMQSLALADDAEPEGEITTETITEADTRTADEEFEPIVSTEPSGDAGVAVTAEPSRRNGMTTLETALLAGAAGLVVGSIVSGNRQVVNRSDDRVVVLRPQGDYQVIRDDDVLLRQPGNGVTTENFSDGSSRSIVTQPDGSQVVTIRDRDLRILRRTYFDPSGRSTVLIDDTVAVQPVIVSQLPQARPVAQTPIIDTTNSDALRLALQAEPGYDRSFSLAQIRSIRAVRDLAPAIDLEAVTFASGSAAIGPEQSRALLALGTYMADAIAANPQEIFLVEGHTDAVGSAAYNLALSDRRAESVALALTQYFGVPAQNLVIQGYGENYLRVATLADERLNRRVAVRRITNLLQVAAAN